MSFLSSNNTHDYISSFESKSKLCEQLLLNEYKHLSIEYRTSKEKMNEILHCDFIEFGKSGKVYSKDDILNAIPLDILNFEIQDLHFLEEADDIVVSYDLTLNNTIQMSCTSKWRCEKGILKLAYFSSEYL